MGGCAPVASSRPGETAFRPCHRAGAVQFERRRHSHLRQQLAGLVVRAQLRMRMLFVGNDIERDGDSGCAGGHGHALVQRGVQLLLMPAHELRRCLDEGVEGIDVMSEHVIGTDAEIEPDDTPEKPFAIPADRTIVHATWTPGDVDCFALAPTNAARTIEVSIDTPNEVDLSADLLIDGRVATTSEHKGKGVAEKLVAQIVAGTRVIVRVRAADPSATAEAAYDIAIQESGVDNAP